MVHAFGVLGQYGVLCNVMILLYAHVEDAVSHIALEVDLFFQFLGPLATGVAPVAGKMLF